MNLKLKLILAAIALLTAFAFGRYSAPERVKTEVKTVEVENKQEQVKTDTDKNRHTETTITEIRRPDGTFEKTMKTTQDTQVTTQKNQSDIEQVTKTQDQTKEVERGSSKVTLSALAGASLSFTGNQSPLIYGGSLTKPVLGPITIGVWGLSNLTGGVSVGLTF